MIRINLLESERAGAGKAKAAAGAAGKPASSGAGIGPYVPVIAGLAVALAGSGYFFTTMSSEISTTNTKIAAAKIEIEKLKVEKAKKEELERKRKSFENQINLIERLNLEKGGPVHMLDEISKALPDFVWLTSMSQAGAALKISGEASTNNAIADFLGNLQRAGDGCDPGRVPPWSGPGSRAGSLVLSRTAAAFAALARQT